MICRSASWARACSVVARPEAASESWRPYPMSCRWRSVLRGCLQLARCRGELARHRRERAALPPDLANDVRDGGGGAVDAHAEKSQLVGHGVRRAALHLLRQIAALDFAEHAACRAQAVDDLHEHGDERHAGEHQHQALLDVERPGPPVPADLGQHGDQCEGGEVDDQRAPRLAALEIERRLQRCDQVGAVQHMAVRPHGEQHRGNQQTADDEVELRVPRLEGTALYQAAHAGVRRHEARRKGGDEPPRDRCDPGELDPDQESDAEPHEAPAGARVREHVLALFGDALLVELVCEGDHMRNR